MHVGRRLAIAALLCAFVFTTPLFARKTPLHGTQPERLLALAKKHGRVAFIIGVRDAGWQPEGKLTAAQVASQRARASARKQQLAKDHPGLVRVPERDFKSIPYFLGVVNEAALRALMNDDRVTSIEEDEEGEFLLDSSVALIGAQAAQARVPGYDGTGQYIVVIDTGVASAHPFLTGRVSQTYAACFSGSAPNYLSVCPTNQNDPVAEPCQVGTLSNEGNPCHHGTQVAGVAIGAGGPVTANRAMTGVAPGAQVIPIQVASNLASQSVAVPLKSSVIQALDHVAGLTAIHDSIAAVNMSLGFPQSVTAPHQRCDSSSTSFRDAIVNVRSFDIAVVAATGNGDGLGNGYSERVTSPACYSSVISVSATTDSDEVASYANTADFVNLFAPGGASGYGNGIRTSQNPACNTSNCGSNGYFETHGTSMAAPHVAGAFALLRQRSPGATIEQLLARLTQTGSPVSGDPARHHNKPRINVNLALDRNLKGDFNNDGHSDLIWRYPSQGMSEIWLMNGFQYAGYGTLPTGGSTWSIAGSDDFNGDAKPDLVWRNSTTFATVLWLMNGTTYVGEAHLPTSTTGDWRIAGTGDFNNDGSPDLVWQNTATFRNVLWLLDGTAYDSEVELPAGSSAAWSIRGVGDFNSDGSPDLVWRHATTFQTVVWLMNGTTYGSQESLPGISGADWNIDAVADYNRDGKPDLVWRNATTHQTVVRYLDGTTQLGTDETLTGAPGAGWQLAGPR